MPRPRPTPIYHFTHIEHLPTVAQHGLLADSLAKAAGYLTHEAGDPGIKDWRLRRVVEAGPGGVVGDYVPFYFAPRSPMMFKLHKGGVPEFTGSTSDLAYLLTTVEHVIAAGGQVVLTDRNAAKNLAAFSAEPEEWDDLVDWPLMDAHIWKSTSDDPERQERRMAECLVHRSVAWNLIQRIVVRDEIRKSRVGAILPPGVACRIDVRPDWYF